ncbi:MAG: FtsH protease activity modulator HflK [Rhodocyclaceae bacterium]|jgi:membrane protease subunit HflK|nr:Modulator of FtsH protease HflK [Rhodocyclaceae bacterium]MBZ0145276.1 FtsH protease activity modulator HflK [Rhodocyclaceae bacterium]MCC6879720.1 FtsH protease activity modulator HflK [Rhodocyclaceae bacterium]MCL4682172.1 FtsH protease activity modulator HflK [Rhodocyclaceae bacterium]
MITGILMSLNDPQWGNRPNQGPPDLEDLWRDFNRRLTGLFGKKGGGGNGGDGPPRPPMNARVFGGGIGAIVVLVLLVWLASGFYIVDASQRGVVLTFGKYSQTTEAGLRWRLPYPIQTHEIVKLSDVRVVEVGYRGSDKNRVLKEALMLTDDENIINIQFAVQWFLKDPEEYLFNNRNPDESVLQAAETAMREVVGKSKMDFALYEGREQVAAQAAKIMQDILDRYGTGIIVSKLTLQNVQPPEQVQAAFDDAVKAGQDRDRQINEGQAYANDVIPRARGTASRLMEEAGGYKARVVANAEGEASRFKQVLVEYNKAPEVTRQRLYLDTVQQVLTSTSKIMIDSKGAGNLLYLPLDKLMQAAGAPVAAANSSEAAASLLPRGLPNLGAEVPPQLERSDTTTRSRDSLRSRERGER